MKRCIRGDKEVSEEEALRVGNYYPQLNARVVEMFGEIIYEYGQIHKDKKAKWNMDWETYHLEEDGVNVVCEKCYVSWIKEARERAV